MYSVIDSTWKEDFYKFLGSTKKRVTVGKISNLLSIPIGFLGKRKELTFSFG